ncbi:MAG: cyclic nucleotide-binding domain-containing protein [Chloroflexi bacterium]|nr:cyclic nucleotide-binding domain-containing protein [Chloroflexota bacterium]
MPVESIPEEDLLRFLRQRTLFEGFEEEDLRQVAGRLGEHKLHAGQDLFKEGAPGETFYIIWAGQVRIWRREGDREIELAILERGDKFGEEAPLFNRPRSANVTTLKDSIFLTLEQENLEWLLRTYPHSKENLTAIAESHRIARRERFDWVQDGEVIHLITRRHWMELAQDLAWPSLLLAASGLVLFGLTIPGLTLISAILGGAGLAAGVLWFLWEAIDWRNDFFMITNRRVIWLERVLLQSDSRREAPLSAIQSVNVDRSFLGRLLDFGQVNVRTFTGTGSLTLTNVSQPRLFQGNIEELLLRVRSKTEEARTDAMRIAIRQSLGLADPDEVFVPPIQPMSPDEKPLRPFRLVRTREVEGNTITYHKHPWVLLMRIWIPLFLLLGVVGAAAFFIWRDFASPEPVYPGIGSAILFGILLGIVPLGMILYAYLDWRNDLYRITKDQIIDSEKKPLGQEITKTAPIRNIQSITHARKGLLRLILNFGTVTVVVADTSLTFLDVHDPATIQQDIFYRQEQLKFEAEEGENERERQRLAEWFKIYHDVTESARPPEDKPEGE